MKHQTQKRKRGFSLVELMISLIAISLITAAFAPIVTKKLSSMGVTVGSFGNGGNSGGQDQNCVCGDEYYPVINQYNKCACKKCSDSLNNCTKCTSATRCTACAAGYQIDPTTNQCISTACAESGGKPSRDCCAEFKAKFIPKEKLGTSHDLCMMQYNAGDNGNSFLVNGEKVVYNPEYVKYNIAMDKPNSSYVSRYSTAQCWYGNQNNTSSGTSIYNNYNANTRTVCDFEAAVRICAIWAPNGSKKGAWRLLTENEATNLATAINSETSDNPENNLTRYKNEDGLQLCDGETTKYGMNYCPSKGYCIGANGDWCQPKGVWIDTKKALLNTNTYGKFGVSGLTSTHGGSVRCVTENVYTADVSNNAYNQGEKDPVDEYEPQSQEDCDPYNALYINKKYIGGEKNICMFKYNAGDDIWTNSNGTYYHPDYIKIGVSMDRANNDKASRYSPAQCWKGTTSTGSGKRKYLPSNRTVCDAEAAKRVCAAWEYGDTKPGDWRLLNATEATALATMLNIDSEYSNYFSRYLDGEGLQLCDGDNANYGMNSCPSKGYCIGADNDWCQPKGVWIDTKKAIMNTNTYGKFEVTSLTNSHGGSVRCVSNLIRGGHNTVQKNTYATNEPSKQEDCDKYSALFIDKYVIKATTGISLSRSLCMTKYNMADKSITNTDIKTYIGENTVEDYANVGVTMVNANTKCTSGSTACCWRGDTSSGTAVYAYNPNIRTACNFKAAALLCQNWNPTNDISKSHWRLLTEQEGKALAQVLNIDSFNSKYFSRYLNEEGLQLCDGDNVNYGMNYCPSKSYCKGADNDWCQVKGVWIETGKAFMNTNSYGKFEVTTLTNTHGGSVRCVSDTVAVE